MNPVVRAQVADYSRINLLDAYTDSEKFELYSIYSILNGGNGETVDAVDGHLKGDEFGLDGVAILVEGKIVTNTDDAAEAIEGIKSPTIDFHFFQAKVGTSFDYGDMSKFFDAIEGFFGEDLADESVQLDDLIAAQKYLYGEAVGRKNPGIHIYYVCTGNYEAPARLERLINTTREKLSDLNIFDTDRLSISMIGAKELQKYYRAASSAVEATIDFPRNVVMPDHDSVEEAYIGYLSADQLLKVISIYDADDNIGEINKSVFFDNIRDFDPDSKINNDISNALLRGESGEFVFRNNGITVVSKSIDRTRDRFRIEDFQVVNGCQTSNIIFLNRFNIDGVNIPFRLIGTKDDWFISSIIAGTNRQNPVREEQFWALRPFMKNFEEYCASFSDEEKIYFERRENQFRGQGVEKARTVQPSTLMKVVAAALLNQPNRSARDYRGITAEYQDVLFQEEHDVTPYYSACYLNYKLDFLWRNQKIDSALKIYRFYLLSGLGRKFFPGDVFKSNKKEVARSSDRLRLLCADEAKLKKAINSIARVVDKIIESERIDIDAREKLRDAIRSEAFAKQFHAQVDELTLEF